MEEGIAHGKQNAESLSETLSALVTFYDAARCKPNASELLENEAEFTQYWLVYFLDQEQGSEAAHMLNRIALERPELYMTEEIQRAASVRKARLDKNWARFFADWCGRRLTSLGVSLWRSTPIRCGTRVTSSVEVYSMVEPYQRGIWLMV